MLGVLQALTAQADYRKPANVPPSFEIEVLDPNADSMGRPAVELRPHKDGQLEVVIPPVVLVHKYYYTGDRSFQAQMLPGGPTIIVVNHPKSGERCYIETNMMPGAPRVTYTGHDITYDFGEHGTTLQFPIFGQPKVKYRSGPTWKQQFGRLIHAEQLQQKSEKLKERSKVFAANTGASVHEFYVDTATAVDSITLPVKQLLRLVPLGTAVFDPDRARVRAEKIDEFRRQQDLKHVEQAQALEAVTRRTNR
jgi:hypothetical protein